MIVLVLPLLLIVLPAARGACPSDEAFPVLQMDKIIGEWNGTHFYGDKTFCSRVEISAQGQDKWSLNRISKSTGHVNNLILQQPDKKSGRLKATDSAGGKFEVIVLTTEYNSHILLQECTPEGNVTTSFLRRPTMSKISADTDLETALYDVNVRKERLQFCEETSNACKKWKTVVAPLDERKMQGVWREAGRIRMPGAGAVQKRTCAYVALEPARDRNGLSLRYSYNEHGKTFCVSGETKYKYPEKKPAILILNQTDTGVGEFWILDTNYDSYAVVSLCSIPVPSSGNEADEGGVLVLSRDGVLTSTDAFAINAAIISVGGNDFVQHFNPGFDRLDKTLDIVPQTCKIDTTMVKCGVDFRMSSPLLICGFLLLVLFR